MAVVKTLNVSCHWSVTWMETVMFDRWHLAFCNICDDEIFSTFQLFSDVSLRVTFWFLWFLNRHPKSIRQWVILAWTKINPNVVVFFSFCLFFCSSTFDNVSYFILRRLLYSQSLWIPSNKHIMHTETCNSVFHRHRYNWGRISSICSLFLLEWFARFFCKFAWNCHQYIDDCWKLKTSLVWCLCVYLRIPLYFAFVIFLLSSTTNSTEERKKQKCCDVYSVFAFLSSFSLFIIVLFEQLTIHYALFKFQVFVTFCHLPK